MSTTSRYRSTHLRLPLRAYLGAIGRDAAHHLRRDAGAADQDNQGGGGGQIATPVARIELPVRLRVLIESRDPVDIDPEGLGADIGADMAAARRQPFVQFLLFGFG